MNVRAFSITLCLTLACASALRADILDTRAQIEARYGQPVRRIEPTKPATGAAIYVKNGIHIAVQYVGDRAAHKKFWQEKGHISLDELNQILESHSNTLDPWVKITPDNKRRPLLRGEGGHWRRAYDSAEAFATYVLVGKKPNRHKMVGHVEVATKSWLESMGTKF